MRSHKLHSILIACWLLTGTVTAAVAQTATQGDDPHHPAQTQADSAPAAPGGAPARAPDGMTGMMMPQMMKMMQMMQGMMGGMAGHGMSGGGMGQGIMCPTMPTMAGTGAPTDSGMHLGVTGGNQAEMTPDRVRTFVQESLTRQGNPRLKIGAVDTAADGSIIVEIVTVDGSLVQKLAFNRYPGLFRQIQ